jgi:L-seryl-tRNA(Ser) seleniumtransferase
MGIPGSAGGANLGLGLRARVIDGAGRAGARVSTHRVRGRPWGYEWFERFGEGPDMVPQDGRRGYPPPGPEGGGQVWLAGPRPSQGRLSEEPAMMEDVREVLAQLPQVDVLLQHDDARVPLDRHGRRSFTEALRAALEEAREAALAGRPVPRAEELIAAADDRLARRRAARLTRVINASGVVLHTNLGRAPLSAAARQAVVDAAGYTNLEFDLETGSRGSRTAHLGALAAELSGTESATVVNNGAGALVLVLAAMAVGKEVIVSRGELIEIGGSYRLPDMMEAAGARLVEVGTTNRTRLADYRAAISDDTALLLKVHRANYRVVGFTEEASLGALAELARAEGIPLVHDLGSGLLRETDGALADEPTVAGSVRAGADLVLYSGDKLLGGPQAGIIAGRAELVVRCARHPFARALRVDKLQRAALEATFESHLRADVPLDIPTVAMVHADLDQLARRAEWLAGELGPGAAAVELRGLVGGGALPGGELASWGVALDEGDAETLAGRLRAAAPPVVARVDRGRVLLDLRTVPPSLDADLRDLVLEAR